MESGWDSHIITDRPRFSAEESKGGLPLHGHLLGLIFVNSPATLVGREVATSFSADIAKARFFKTRQMEPNEKGFVGYETIWEPFHKEVKYTTPKRP